LGCGDRKAENVVGPVPTGTLASGERSGFQTTGRMVRVITFQSSLTWIGITGWMLRTSCTPPCGPAPKFALFWNGKL
jgi:hypothetical protein